MQSFVVSAARLRPTRRRDRVRSRPDTGAVTVETAIAMLALVFLLAVLSWFLVVLGAQLRAGDAARAAARLAARGESFAAVRDEARRIAPGATVELTRTGTGEGTRVVVRTTQLMRPPTGMLADLGSMTVRSEATAMLETP